MDKLLANMESIFRSQGRPVKHSMRHTKDRRDEAETIDLLADLPMEVPKLPMSVVSRNAVTSVLRGHVLARGTNKRIMAFGQGGVGESFLRIANTTVIVSFDNDVISFIQARQCWPQLF